jgi:hypothetical protein
VDKVSEPIGMSDIAIDFLIPVATNIFVLPTEGGTASVPKIGVVYCFAASLLSLKQCGVVGGSELLQ